MRDGPTTNTNLVLRLRDHRDEAAWDQFVQIYQPMILNLVRRKGFQDADACELAQDVLLAVMRAVKRFDPENQRGSFRGWIATITRRLMINCLSSPARRLVGSGRTSVLERLLELPASNETESLVFDLELKIRLFEWAADEVRNQVTPLTWQAFWRTAILMTPPRQVAKELGLQPGAVYVAKSRVMRQLRVSIQRQLEIEEKGEARHE